MGIKNNLKDENGFLLLEAIIYTSIVFLLSGFLVFGYITILKNLNTSEQRISTRRAAQQTFQQVSRLTREASKVKSYYASTSTLRVWNDANYPRTPLTTTDDTEGALSFDEDEGKLYWDEDVSNPDNPLVKLGENLKNCDFEVTNSHFLVMEVKVEREYGDGNDIIEDSFSTKIALRNYPH